MTVCKGDLTNPCVRELWSTLPAITFVALLLLFSLPVPLPRLVSKNFARIRAPLLPTLTVSEAEELERQFAVEDSSEGQPSELPPLTTVTAPRWRTTLFAVLTFVEVGAWLALGIMKAIHAIRHMPTTRSFDLLPFIPLLVWITWVYAFARIVHRPPMTPPYDLFILFILHLAGGVVTFGGQLYSSRALGSPLPSDKVLAAEGVHLGILTILLTLIVSLPLNIPSAPVNKETTPIPSPEDHIPLISWITFQWVRPLVVAGTSKTLNDEDVWDISPTLKTRPTFFTYKQTAGTSLFWRLLRANSMDLLIDFSLTEFSAVLEFAGPYFLRSILEILEDPNPQPGSRDRLYLYAVLAFGASMIKTQSDLQHLWYGRRASSRIGTQLSAAIYDKAIRIVDQSGVIDPKKNSAESNGKAAEDAKSNADGKNKGKDKGKDKDKDKDKETEEDESKSGADVGKIVNLMGIDAQKVMNQVVGMPHIYNAPISLVLSCLYLYQLLGVSAFAGFVSLVVVVPLSQVLAKMVMRITKGTLAAKDSRMKLVNEMFGAIKFIKFFAWEEQWIKKIIEARQVEIDWLRKSRNVNIYYGLLWNLVPTLISIASFFTYVITGHVLSVSVAFTAIRLFEMLTIPLTVLPYAMVTFAQTKVSLDRLKAFFDEGEVPEDVSTLTRPVSKEPEDLSIEQGTFTWTKSGSGKSSESDKASTPSTSSSTNEIGTTDESIATASVSTRTAVERGNQEFELKDITVKIVPRQLTVVTGSTASGKTALLMALLGEMDRHSGSVSIPKNPTIVDQWGLRNSISYAAQTPWLQQQSIKDNITFEYPFDQERYDAVVEACALNPDFKALEDGDLTEIGSKGVSLSGGQKARVALARAVYAPTQYIILDDIFSAVDSHTARFLFEKLLKGPLVANRTVLLVTHHVELVLPGTHYLIHMSEGRIDRQGTVEDLKKQGLLDYIAHEHEHDKGKAEEAQGGDENTRDATDGNGKPKQARKLVEEEVRSEGEVKWDIYKKYLKASSYWTWVFVVTGVAASEACEVGTRVWMSVWGTAYRQPATSLFSFAFSRVVGHAQVLSEPWPMQHRLVFNNLTMAGHIVTKELPDATIHPLFYVGIYSAIGLLAGLVSIFTQWALFTGGLRSGMVLFKELLNSLSRATFRFFDTTPTGRILNRFGKDFDQVDGMLPWMIEHVTVSVARFLGAVITVTFVVPWFLPVGALLAYCYVKLSIGYLAAGRDLRRMESTSRSPILAGFSDLVSGIVTVRAFSAERQFLHGHYKRVDTSQRFWYFTWMLNRWLLLQFDVLGAVSVFASTMFVLAGFLPVGYAALSIVSAMTFSQNVYWTCRGYTELELCLNSVERVVEYLDIPKEPPAAIEGREVPAYWPSSTDNDSLLVVDKLEVKYAPELPSVIRGISFSLKARERVGLLGRTGCGKSTLAMSLLRFVEPTGGKIIIDGIDITTIGTRDLRSRLTFIPQDATLFAGTIRENLDPFSEHSDAECLDVLARVHLITPSSQKSSRTPSRAPSIHEEERDENRPSSSAGSETATQSDVEGKVAIKLDTTVSAGGQNFSNGQRQLLAMARALLRQNGVVIMDEATSSIDKAADVKIQAAIREEFNQSLLLTIAHRLATIIDFDRLIVLDKGQIVEFDTPYNLIQKEGGVFREMCLQSGTYKELEAAAKAQAELHRTA